MNSIADKTILLTGASGGIGSVIARQLAQQQTTIIAVSRSLTGLDRICTEIESLGGKAKAIPFDLTNVDELPALVEEVNRVAGSVDILINNAAVEKFSAFADYSLADMQSMLTTNLLAVMELSRLILSDMLARNSGHIVNIASLAGKKGTPYNSVYSATKAGLIAWSDALRQELHDSQVGISVVSPGYVDAGMFAKLVMEKPEFVNPCPPEVVAEAVFKAIAEKQAEITVNGGIATLLLFAIGQFAPQFVDGVYRRIGLTELNKSLVANLKQKKELAVLER